MAGAVALVVALAAFADPAIAKKGGNPAWLVNTTAAPAPAVSTPAVAPAVAPATAPTPTSSPPGQAKAKPGKVKGNVKTNGNGRNRALPVVAQPPAPAPAVAPARARAPVTAAPAAAPRAVSGRRTTVPSTRRTGRRAARRPASRQAPAPSGLVAAPASTATRAAAAAAAAPARQAARRGARSVSKQPERRSSHPSLTSLFTPPSVRDVAGVSPAVTRLVEVIPTFVWLILAALALLAAMLAAAVAIAARRLRRAAEREQQLAGLAATDPLTGLLNRRGIEAHIASELGRAVRYGGTLAVVFGDLRALKTINDRHGHDAGDRALQTVAEVLRGQAREGDACGRVGGDEYAVALANQGAEGADAFCGRVRARLRQTPVPGVAPELDLTLGVALFPRDGDTPEALLAAADRDLYAQRGITVGGS